MGDIAFLDSVEDRLLLRGCSCAFGVFDGVHRGHRFLIGQACASAREHGGDAVILTFDVDPDELFHPKRLHKLMSNEERLEALAETGVNTVAVLRFTRQFAALSPEEFLASTFEGSLPNAIHVGCDIRFGNKACGSLETLRSWGDAHGVHVFGHDLVAADGVPITSTRIRLLLADGRSEDAQALL